MSSKHKVRFSKIRDRVNGGWFFRFYNRHNVVQDSYTILYHNYDLAMDILTNKNSKNALLNSMSEDRQIEHICALRLWNGNPIKEIDLIDRFLEKYR